MVGCAETAPPIAVDQYLVQVKPEASPARVGALQLRQGAGCGGDQVEVGLWLETLATPGFVAAQAEIGVRGETWLHFPLRTGVGEGEGALRIQGSDVRLPLGGRSGEFDVQFRLEPGPVDGASFQAQREAADTRLIAEERAWANGSFLLQEDGRTVGALTLRGPDAAPLIAVFDHLWLTPAPIAAQRRDDGGDLLLVFPVEPALQDEEGLLRINVPTRRAVVPVGPVPTADDRHLALVPGVLSDAELRDAIAGAKAEADAAELGWVQETLPRLVRGARRDGVCLAPAEVDPNWPLLLEGYQVQIIPDGDGCVAVIEPVVTQHRRRFEGWVGPSGVTGPPGEEKPPSTDGAP